MVTVNRTALLCFSLHACFFILLIRTFSFSYLHWGLDFWVYEKCPLLSDILICLSPTFCYASFLSLCYPSAFTSFPALALLFLLLSYPSSSLCTFSSSYHCRFLFTPSNTPFILIACLTASLSLFFQPSPPSLYPSLFFPLLVFYTMATDISGWCLLLPLGLFFFFKAPFFSQSQKLFSSIMSTLLLNFSHQRKALTFTCSELFEHVKVTSHFKGPKQNGND